MPWKCFKYRYAFLVGRLKRLPILRMHALIKGILYLSAYDTFLLRGKVKQNI